MSQPDPSNDTLLWKYQERSGDPGFWAEPFNALTNLAFIVAAVLAWRLAVRKSVRTTSTDMLIVLAAIVGVGSFVFHTLPNQLTLWLDIIPILLFQVGFIWSFCRKVLRLGPLPTIVVLALVIGTALLLRPIRYPMNGSLFYVPPLLALLIFGWFWAEKNQSEPWILFAAGVCFSLAVIARSVDWEVDFRIGTHFLWHFLNGIVVYLSLRTVILFESADWSPRISGRDPEGLGTLPSHD